MKISNFTPETTQERTFNIVGKDLTFKAKVITDFKAFEELCPTPLAPIRVTRDNVKTRNVKDPKFLEKLEAHGSARMVYMIMESLSVTEGIEWTLLDPADVETMTEANLMQEFGDAGIPEMIANKIIRLATDTNGLTDTLLKDRRETFLPEEEELVEALPLPG